ncbi:MAG: hypothetical protein GF353_24460 [Candidatus Lokiarchaeota archaeon]|nr:hypothetical protein [Candidatus Lokiarchaeota archaeon]
MQLEPIEYLQGSLSLIYIIISLILGIFILLKYFEHKNPNLVYVGLTWILISFPWLCDATSFLMILILGVPLSEMAYLTLVNAFIPLTFIVWFMAFTNLLYKENQKLIIAFLAIFAVIFEIIFFYVLFTNTAQIGSLVSPFHAEYSLFIQVYLFLSMTIFLITGIIFGKESLKSENPEIKLKGKLLILAFISFFIGALLEALFTLNAVLLVITRSILILSAIEFYGGFTLPDWMKKLLLKNE